MEDDKQLIEIMMKAAKDKRRLKRDKQKSTYKASLKHKLFIEEKDNGREQAE